MRYDDFCKCTFGEFESICKSWREMTENSQRDEWERTRTLAAICIQPHIRKKITPRQLLPLPWDNKKPVKRNHQTLTPDERLKRFAKIANSV